MLLKACSELPSPPSPPFAYRSSAIISDLLYPLRPAFTLNVPCKFSPLPVAPTASLTSEAPVSLSTGCARVQAQPQSCPWAALTNHPQWPHACPWTTSAGRLVHMVACSSWSCTRLAQQESAGSAGLAQSSCSVSLMDQPWDDEGTRRSKLWDGGARRWMSEQARTLWEAFPFTNILRRRIFRGPGSFN